MEVSNRGLTAPMTHERHSLAEQIIKDIDKVLAEESNILIELHRIVEQNGSELLEEQLVFNYFSAIL